MGRSQELLDAAREGDKKIVEKILGQITKRSGPFTSLRRGAGVNVQDDNGYTPLHHACLRGHKEIVALLLSVDASPCIADKKGATALHLAAWKGDADVVSMLLNHRHPAANIDSMTSDQETALLIACQFGNVDVVASLLTRGANVDLRNCKGESPLDLAAQYGRLDTVQHLLQSRPQLVEPYALPLSRKRMYETTPLHRASKNGHREVVSTLIAAGFDPNVRTLTGTALHEAATFGKASVVRILLNKGADLHATDRSGRTVQHLLNEYSEEATRRVRRIIREHIAANGYAYESEDELPPFPPVNDYSPTGYPTAGISSETHKKAKEKDHLSPPSPLINKTSHHSQSFVKKLASKFGIKAKFNSAPNISNTSRLESEAALKLDTNKNSPKKSSSSTLLIGNSKFFKRLSKREESGEIVCTDEFDTVSLDCLATLDRAAVVNRSNRSCPGFKTSLPNISENTELSDSLESFHSSDESNNKINSLRRHHAEAVNKIPKLSIFEPRQTDDPRTSNISGQSVVNEYYESYENHTVHNNDNTSAIPKPIPRPKPKAVANKENDVIYQNVDVSVHRNAPPVPAARSTDTKTSVYENVNPPLRKAPDPPKRTVLPVITEPKVSSNESSPNISRTSTLSSNEDEAIFEDILLSKKSTSFKLKKKLSLYNSESDSLRRTESLRSDSSDYTEASALDNVDCTDDLDQNSIYMSMTGTLPNKKPEPEVKKKILFRNKTFTSTEVERNSIRKDLPKQTYDKEFLKETLAHYHIRGTGHCVNKAPTVEEFIYIFNRDALYTDTPPFEKVPNKRESYFETAICFCKPRPPKHHKSFEDLLEAPKETEEKVVIDLESLKASTELNATSFKCFCNEGTCKFHENNRESIFNFVVKFSAINKSISTPNISLDSLPSNKKLRLSKINSIPANLEDPYAVVDVKDILSRKQSNDSDTKSINYATMSQTSTASRPYSVKDISDAMSNTASPDTSLSYNASMCIRNSSSSEISGKWSLKTCNSNTTVKSDNSFKSCIEEMISSDEDSESDETNEPSDTDTIKSDVSTSKRPWVHSDSFRFGSSSKLNDPEVILEETELITPSSDVNYGQLALELLKMTNDINNLELTNAPSTSSNNLSKSETSTSGIETNLIDFDSNTKTDDSSLECTNVESGIESETSQSDSQSDFEYKRLDSDPNQTNPSSEENDNNLEVDKPVGKDPGVGVVCEGLELEFGGASLERGLLGAVVHSGSGRRRWDEGEGTSEGDALSLSSAASSCAPHHLVHHMEYNKVSPTPPKKPPRRNLSVSPTHANSPSGYSYDLRPHARSQDDLDDIPGAKNYLKHGRSVDQYVNSKLSYSEYEETQTPPRVPPVPNPRPSLKTRTQPVAITAMYENVIIKEQNPKRKLRRSAGPGFETNDGRPKIQERSSVESLLDDSMSPSDCERYYEGPRVDIPLSPSHYNAPPTPDHPPPSAKQAENSIHERIRPLSQEYKRRSALRNSYTETEVVLLRAPSAVSVASGATDNCVEEYVCDVPFAGLFKGSTTTLDGIGLRPMPAERPKTLKKLKSVYDTSPSEAPTSNFANITSNGTQHNQNDRQNDRQGERTGGYGNGDKVNGEDGVRRRSNTNSSCGDKSLSILSPFDEQEEWAKISEIMASFGSKLVRESVFVSELEQEFTARLGVHRSEWSPSCSPSCASSMGSWLASLGLADYEGLLLQHGYDDVDFINGIIDEADLKEMGIDEADRTKILDTTKHLPNKILDISNNYNNITIASQNENVDKWLRDIKLEEYSDIFRRHLYVDMERVRRIWDVELTAVLEIQKVGHRKRILASVCGLMNGPVSNLEDINADLQCLKNNIQLLKDDIKVKLPDNLKPVPPPTLPPTAGETLKRSKKKPAPQPPKPSDLEIRAPSELLVGVPGALKTQWKHQPFVLVTGAVTYVANYLGSTVVKELRGTESTKKSIQKLKKSTKEPRDSPDIILSISYRGVKFLNTVTRELVCEHEVRNIHCACQDADDLTHFAYITKDHDTKSHYCHVFRVATMEQATEVILTLGEAFEVAYQMALREQSNRVKPPPQSRTPTHDSTNKERPQNHGRSHSITEIKLNGHQLKLAPIPTSLSTEDFQSTRSAEGNRSPRTQMLKAPIASTEEL